MILATLVRQTTTWIVVAAAVALLRPAETRAQSARAEASRSIADAVYTTAQADRGAAAFRTSCAPCHARSKFTDPKFLATWQDRRVYELFRNISSLMPDDDPGSLARRTYVDILAYLFQLNGYPAGKAELDTTDAVLKAVRIVGR